MTTVKVTSSNESWLEEYTLLFAMDGATATRNSFGDEERLLILLDRGNNFWKSR